MAVTILDPIANGANSQGTKVGSVSTKWESVLRPDDDLTSYVWVFKGSGLSEQSYYMGGRGNGQMNASAVQSLTLFARAQCQLAFTGTMHLAIRLNTVNVFEPSQSGDLGGNFVNRTSPDLARPGGGNYSPADFPGNGTAGVQAKPSAGSNSNTSQEVRYTTMYLNVTFTPSAGTILHLVAQWLAPLVLGGFHALSTQDIYVIVGRALYLKRIPCPTQAELQMLRELYRFRPTFIS